MKHVAVIGAGPMNSQASPFADKDRNCVKPVEMQVCGTTIGRMRSA